MVVGRALNPAFTEAGFFLRTTFLAVLLFAATRRLLGLREEAVLVRVEVFAFAGLILAILRLATGRLACFGGADFLLPTVVFLSGNRFFARGVADLDFTRADGRLAAGLGAVVALFRFVPGNARFMRNFR